MSFSFLQSADPRWMLDAGSWFATQDNLSFGIAEELSYQSLMKAAKEQVEDCRNVSATSIREGLEKVLLSKNAALGLEWLKDIGLLHIWLPEVAATVDLSQESGRMHKDVWQHTKQVVHQSAVRPLVRWASLLHDIGKVPTRTFAKNGKVHFHGHAEVGAQMFEAVQARLQFEPKMADGLRSLILNHLRPNQYQNSWTDSAVRRFVKETEPYLEDLLDLSRADVTSEKPGRRQEVLDSVKVLADRIHHVKEEDQKIPLLPRGMGDEIMRKFALSPSRLLGSLKSALEEAVSSGLIKPGQEVSYYLDYVSNQLEEYKKQDSCKKQ